MQAILPTSSTPDEFRRSGGGKTAAEASRQDLDGAGPAAMPDLEIKREKTTTASPSLAHPIQLADNNEGGGSCNGLHNAVGKGDRGRSTPPGSGAHPTAAASAADSPAENFTAAQAGAALAEVASGGQGHGCVVNNSDTTNTTDNMATCVSRAPHLPLPTPAVNVNLMLENARLRDEVEALRMSVFVLESTSVNLKRRDVEHTANAEQLLQLAKQAVFKGTIDQTRAHKDIAALQNALEGEQERADTLLDDINDLTGKLHRTRRDHARYVAELKGELEHWKAGGVGVYTAPAAPATPTNFNMAVLDSDGDDGDDDDANDEEEDDDEVALALDETTPTSFEEAWDPSDIELLVDSQTFESSAEYRVKEYLVRWKGLDEEEDTWLPVTALLDGGAADAILDFKAKEIEAAAAQANRAASTPRRRPVAAPTSHPSSRSNSQANSRTSSRAGSQPPDLPVGDRVTEFTASPGTPMSRTCSPTSPSLIVEPSVSNAGGSQPAPIGMTSTGRAHRPPPRFEAGPATSRRLGPTPPASKPGWEWSETDHPPTPPRDATRLPGAPSPPQVDSGTDDGEATPDVIVVADSLTSVVRSVASKRCHRPPARFQAGPASHRLRGDESEDGSPGPGLHPSADEAPQQESEKRPHDEMTCPLQPSPTLARRPSNGQPRGAKRARVHSGR